MLTGSPEGLATTALRATLGMDESAAWPEAGAIAASRPWRWPPPRRLQSNHRRSEPLKAFHKCREVRIGRS